MTDRRDENERDLLAAEHALGLLTGVELMKARGLASRDPAFAALVAGWEERLAPFAGEIQDVEPGPGLLDRIRRAIAESPSAGGEVVRLGRAVRRWRAYAAAVSAVAAALLLFVGVQAGRSPPVAAPPPAAEVLVASLASEGSDPSLAAAYDSRRASLLVSPGRLAAARGHAHELWIIPGDGAPVSLGLVRAGQPYRMPVAPALAAHFHANATLAVTVEPTGGSPTGEPTGPVVASGPLLSI